MPRRVSGYRQMTVSRASESALLQRCLAVIRAMGTQGACEACKAADAREAHVFLLASSAIRSRYPIQAQALSRAAEAYFDVHPGDRLAPEEAVRRGWVISVPRFRDMLERQIAVTSPGEHG